MTVLLIRGDFSSSPLETIVKDLANDLGLGGLTAWYLAGEIYDRICGRPER